MLFDFGSPLSFLLLLYIHSIVSSSDLARIAFLTPYFLVDSNKKKELCFDWSQILDVRTLSGPYSEMGQYAWTSRFEALGSGQNHWTVANATSEWSE